MRHTAPCADCGTDTFLGWIRSSGGERISLYRLSGNQNSPSPDSGRFYAVCRQRSPNFSVWTNV